MADTNVANDKNTLSPLLDGLSEHLIAEFFEVKKDNNGSWSKAENSVIVKSPLTECNMDLTAGWQSPFEGSGTDRGMPALSAMLQSGALKPWVGSDGKMGSALSLLEGRSGVTKLNSTQTFSGMPPAKIQLVALFRAWADPIKEVEEPVNKLMEWFLPENLAPDGAILEALKAAADATSGKTKLTGAIAEGMLPSKSPIKIGMKYKKSIYLPMVIEGIGKPLASPVDKNGNFVELLIPITLCSLTAWDRSDWTNTYAHK